MQWRVGKPSSPVRQGGRSPAKGKPQDTARPYHRTLWRGLRRSGAPGTPQVPPCSTISRVLYVPHAHNLAMLMTLVPSPGLSWPEELAAAALWTEYAVG